MKRVVFLLALCVMSGRGFVAAASETYSFDTYELELQNKVNEEGNKGYNIIKRGENPFSRTLFIDGVDVMVNGISEVENHHVFYGYLINREDEIYIGFYVVLSSSGEEVILFQEEDNYDSEITHVFSFDAMMVVISRQTTQGQSGQADVLQHDVHLLDSSFDPLQTLELFKDFKRIEQTEQLIVFYEDYDDEAELGLTKQMTLITKDDPLELSQDQVFDERVELLFLNLGLLNDTVVHHGFVIEYPGNYTFVYQGYEYVFHVKPSIEGVTDGGIYNSTVTPFVSSGNMYLNNDSFVSGTAIEEPGYYTLRVVGVNGYTETIEFTITSNVEGILHNTTYYEEVDVSFDGVGYLNNQFIGSPYTISEPGEYLLRIEGENQYVEQLYFTIEEPPRTHTWLDFLQQYDFIILGLVVISGLLVLKKK